MKLEIPKQNYIMYWISVVILIVSLAAQVQCQYGSLCKTTDDVEGICVPVRLCKPAYEFFKQISKSGRQISASEIEEIRSLHCGTFNNEPHICCEKSKVQTIKSGLDILKNQKCGEYSTEKVTHGYDAKLSGYPWMALLVYTDEDDHFKCAGSLITEHYVLTAAHCIKGKETRLIAVRLGEHRKSTAIDCETFSGYEVCAPPAEDIDIGDTILHPEYRAIYNDIALIRLKRKVQFQKHIRPLCLPIYDDLKGKVHNQYVISGWGRTETGNSSDVLKVALLPRVDVAACAAQLRPFKFTLTLNESHMCAGGQNLVDTCKGDSGGPLGFSDRYNGRPRFVQYGIVAAGLTKCGEVDVPGIYTNVSYHMQWIMDNITED